MNSDLASNARSEVMVLAQYLEISEYELFQHAHQQWFGEETLLDVEREFGQYLLYAAVPVWVRHFVREQSVTPAPSMQLARTVYFGSALKAMTGRVPLLLQRKRKDERQYLSA